MQSKINPQSPKQPSAKITKMVALHYMILEYIVKLKYITCTEAGLKKNTIEKPCIYYVFIFLKEVKNTK
jgi:hypothetical protein